MNFPGFYALNLTAAVRYEAFENNDTNVAVPKFGIRWQPFDETLTVRATIGEGFREPSLIELYASPTSALTGSQDILPGPNEGGFRPDAVETVRESTRRGPERPRRVQRTRAGPVPDKVRARPPTAVASSTLLVLSQNRGSLSRAARSSSLRTHGLLAVV